MAGASGDFKTFRIETPGRDFFEFLAAYHELGINPSIVS